MECGPGQVMRWRRLKSIRQMRRGVWTGAIAAVGCKFKVVFFVNINNFSSFIGFFKLKQQFSS